MVSFRNHFPLRVDRHLSVPIPPCMGKHLTSIGIKNFWMLYVAGIANVNICHNQDDIKRKCEYLRTLGELKYSPLKINSKGRIILTDEFHDVTNVVISGRGKSLMIETEDSWQKRVARIEQRMAQRIAENPYFTPRCLLPCLPKAN